MRRNTLVFLGLSAMCTLGVTNTLAQTGEFPIDGGNSTVLCRLDSNLQRTGKPFGSWPTTVTGCTLGADAPFLLPGPGVSVECRAGGLIQFYPGIARLRSCVVARDGNLRDQANAPVVCRAGFNAAFTDRGFVVACNTPAPGGGGGGGGGGVTTGGGITVGGGGGNFPPPFPPPPSVRGGRAPIIVPGETAQLAGGGQYTSIGKSSNRPGGRAGYLYLGDGRASATYTVTAPAAGRYALWIRFDDDGVHPPGARSVEIAVNGALALRWSNESRDTKGWVNLPVGNVDLRAGVNTVVFTKAATTSAAFVLDEFVLSDQAGFVPQ